MKINPIAHQAASNIYNTPCAKTPAPSFHSAMDQVSLSAEVISFSAAISRIKEQMGMRAPHELARIAEITVLIQRGVYHVPAEKVAEKIVGDYLY